MKQLKLIIIQEHYEINHIGLLKLTDYMTPIQGYVTQNFSYNVASSWKLGAI